MAWSTPRTWASGEDVTAALFNAEIRDNLRAIGGTFESYGPTWTNLTVGNGTVSAAYLKAGTFVRYYGKLTFGSTTSVTGSLGISLPVNRASLGSTAVVMQGGGTCYDVSTSSPYHRFAVTTGSTVLRFQDASGNATTASTPFTWATGDTLSWSVTYEGA